jgi:hypothetical protein
VADIPPSSASPPDESGTGGTGPVLDRPKIGWRGRLTTALAGIAGGMAVNDLSGSLGYRGLAGILGVVAVLIATTWIRTLDARAWLPRRASWLFLTPAAASAAGAAFSTGRAAGILTSVAVILTVAAILLTGSVEVASQLLSGVAPMGFGVAGIGFGVAMLLDGWVPGGVAFIGAGVALIGYGVAMLLDGWVPGGVATIGAGVAFIGGGVAIVGPAEITSAVLRFIDSITSAAEHKSHESQHDDG